ncbi:MULTISPECIES: hypothetical protein [Bacillus cereus group]|uniref:hypothetical protein n=1 Tax=Bacillus cereus group TaxID=86661 RepID=UPI000AF6E0E1|nr:hypothetical protein [Bacillus cereus]WPQ42863.1 hypothetical protein SH594_09400 [Bacillus cereus]
MNVSFLAFHYLDNDEEIKFFNVINTKAKGNGTNRFLSRENDYLIWVFHGELIITVIFLLLLNPFAPHLITEYFIMKLLSA